MESFLKAARWAVWLTFLSGLGFFTLFEIRVVEGSSMAPLLPPGTRVLIYRWAYGPRPPIVHDYWAFWSTPLPGEIIAFHHPIHHRESVKAVFARPGEKLRLEGNTLVQADWTVPLDPHQRAGVERLERVPEWGVYVVGLNAPQSTDSRDWGPLPLVAIVGRVVFSWR